jgi:hypothetical protein
MVALWFEVLFFVIAKNINNMLIIVNYNISHLFVKTLT